MSSTSDARRLYLSVQPNQTTTRAGTCACEYLGQGECRHRGLSVVGVPRKVPGSQTQPPGVYLAVHPDYNTAWGWEVSMR